MSAVIDYLTELCDKHNKKKMVMSRGVVCDCDARGTMYMMGPRVRSGRRGAIAAVNIRVSLMTLGVSAGNMHWCSRVTRSYWNTKRMPFTLGCNHCSCGTSYYYLDQTSFNLTA
jgi:hypothetical protein